MHLFKKDRVIIIRHIQNSFSEISSDQLNNYSIETICSDETSYFTTPHTAFNEIHDVYLFPFLLEQDGSPWHKANLFLFTATRDSFKGYAISNEVRQKAGWLLDYKIFCEQNKINLMDFSGRKPTRPTYRYFFELSQEVHSGIISRKILNKKTKVVYDFYKFISRQPGTHVDIERVDTIESLKIFFTNHHGRSLGVSVEKRGQSLKVFSKGTPVPIGFVRDSGEDLRPLKEKELEELIRVLNSDNFSADERIIHFIGIETGARKQTILTLRMKHLKEFLPEKMLKDGTYKINAGPGTGIDTKFDKPQSLYFPQQLADQIRTYASCKKSQERRSKFIAKNGNIIDQGDMYLFISPEGDAHYMAKSDPRYRTTKSRPQGRNTYYIKNKILKHANKIFPKDFTFHWTRATYALLYYRWLQPLSAKGLITDGDIISMVQKKMHHSDRTTTEKYLKLFDSIDERVEAQNLYEKGLLESYIVSSGDKI